MKKPAYLAVLIYVALCVGQAHAANLDDLLCAIRQVETGGQPNGGRDATGDNGKSIGPFCISKACWIDSRVPGKWEDCRDYAYACRVAKSYFARYCPAAVAAGDWQTVARIWNGGPQGHKKQATIGYWIKVKTLLERI